MDNTVYLGSPANSREVDSLTSGLMATPIYTKDFTDIANELIPLMKELMYMYPGNIQHPSFKQLFNWLSNPLRSADEFIYVVGPLKKYLWKAVDSSRYVSDGYLGKIAAEALAVLCPILEGPWEHAAWVVLTVSDSYCASNYGYASDVLSAWIIHIIGNPEICPNPYLRIRLIYLLNKVDIEKENNVLILQAVMSALSALKVENGLDCLHLIYTILSEFTTDGYILKMDVKLSEILQDMKTSRLSAILHESTDKICTDANKYIIPVEVHGLTALLKTLGGHAQKLYESKYLILIFEDLYKICNLLQLIFDNFIISCQMPQMICTTSLCIINVFEYLCQVTVMEFFDSQSGQYTSLTSLQTLDVCEKVLKQLCYKEIALTGVSDPRFIKTTPIGQDITRKYCKRLNRIRNHREMKILVLVNLERYPILNVLLDY